MNPQTITLLIKLDNKVSFVILDTFDLMRRPAKRYDLADSCNVGFLVRGSTVIS